LRDYYRFGERALYYWCDSAIRVLKVGDSVLTEEENDLENSGS